MKIVHITTAHPALDVRIFYKECKTLVNAGHEVHLVALHSPIDFYQGIAIHALNSHQNLSRLVRLRKIFSLAKTIRGDVYHFHDPEFIPFAWLLKLKGKIVFYDVHEDTPEESFSFNKHKPLIAWFKYYRWIFLEAISKKLFNGFICATPTIASNFPVKKTIIVRNYIDLTEFNYEIRAPFVERENIALYMGSIMRIRGLKEMLAVIDELTAQNAKLKLIGNFSPTELRQEATNFAGWKNVIAIDWLPREKLLPHLYTAKMGLVLLHPEKNFKDALPIKLFEYMAAGLPVIVSDFPIWRKIVLDAGCGIVVDPFDIKAIKEGMMYLFNHSNEAEKMGQAGRRAIKKYYCWQSEANQLTRFYAKVVGENQ